MTRNFNYLDLLQNKLVVEQDVVSKVNTMLVNNGFSAVKTQMSQGELTLSGTIPIGKKELFAGLIGQVKEIPGVRTVLNYVTEAAPHESVINISERYSVTGVSQVDNGALNAIINGRILQKGDVLDGMTITSITPNMVLLEKDGITYRIDMRR
jgi:type III secretion system YscD/HrpQ family protein